MATSSEESSPSWPRTGAWSIGGSEYASIKLRDAASDLFCDGPDIQVETVRFDADGAHDQYLANETELEEYLHILEASSSTSQIREDHCAGASAEYEAADAGACIPEPSVSDGSSPTITANASTQRSTIIILEPPTGWSPLSISYRGMLSILLRLQIFSPFERSLRIFGLKSYERDEALGGFDVKVDADGFGSADCKYWSIRQTLVYQQIRFEDHGSSSTMQANQILVRVSDEMGLRLSHLVRAPVDVQQSLVQDWTQLHIMLVDTLEDGLRGSINYLDCEIKKLYDRALMSSVDPKAPRHFDTLDQISRDLKLLQHLEDSSLRIARAAQVNVDTLAALSLLGTRQASRSKPDTQCSSRERDFVEIVDEIKRRHVAHVRTATSLVAQAQAVMNQYRDTINLRNSEVSRQGMEATGEHTSATLELTAQSGREAHVLKTLTVIALIFVPASFAADFLQMDYIAVDEDHRGLRLNAKPGLQLYAIITIPLVTFTMMAYVLSEFLQQRTSHTKNGVARKC